MKIEKIILMLFLILFVLVLLQTETMKTSLSDPEIVVRHYFQAWNNNSFIGMYNDISDGFKEIEPTAANITSFTKLIKSSQVTGVEIVSTNITSNYGGRANVDFQVIYNISGTLTPSESNFVLRFKPNDKNPGWKIIQPYGEKADEA